MANLAPTAAEEQDAISPEEWLEAQFEFELCSECGGDAKHHTVFYNALSLYVAICQYPRDESGNVDPVIAKFRCEEGYPAETAY